MIDIRRWLSQWESLTGVPRALPNANGTVHPLPIAPADGEPIPDSIRERARLICSEFESSHKEILPTLALHRKQFKERLQEELWIAACWRDYQLSCVQKAYDAEIEQIEQEYESEKNNMKERLLNDLLSQRKKLIEGVTTGLGDHEIHEDLVLILRDEYGNGAGIGRRTRNNGNHPIKTSDGDHDEVEVLIQGETLKICKDEFTEGDSVIIGTPDSTELGGTIFSLGLKEIWIKIDDGAKLKITFQQLQSGRYSLSHADDSFSSSSSSS